MPRLVALRYRAKLLRNQPSPIPLSLVMEICVVWLQLSPASLGRGEAAGARNGHEEHRESERLTLRAQRMQEPTISDKLGAAGKTATLSSSASQSPMPVMDVLKARYGMCTPPRHIGRRSLLLPHDFPGEPWVFLHARMYHGM